MRIPGSIDVNYIKTYELPSKFLPQLQHRTLQSYNFHEWDESIPKSLQTLCIEIIAEHWAEHPVLGEIILPVDRYHLLDILSPDLPLSLTIPKIDENVYWRRCYLQRWPKNVPDQVQDVEFFDIVNCNDVRKRSIVYSTKDSDSGGSSRVSSGSRRRSVALKGNMKKSWKVLYIEMHVREYLEKLKPEDYDAEKLKELSDLCAPYVTLLRLIEMQCSETSSNRIPLNSILTGFHNLKELCICMKQTYSGEKFSWNVVQTSIQDIKLLMRGLEKLKSLKIFRMQNSDINGEKTIGILKALLKQNIKVLEFSNCKIGDRGMYAVSKFILDVPVTEVCLPNNKIGADGMEAFSYAIRQKSCKVKTINIRLNDFGDQGVKNILNSLVRNGETIKILLISGCGITKMTSFKEMLCLNKNLEVLDISNNRIGEDCSRGILEALNYNVTIRDMDLRMCQITSDMELKIQEILSLNRKQLRKLPVQLPFQENPEGLVENNDIEQKLHNIFEQNLFGL